MPDRLTGTREPADLLSLREAFQVFSQASETLQRSYAELQLETRRLSLELAAANEELQRAQRLQAMGEMAVQLAHEIRNPLGSIELFASLLAGELQERPEVRNWADQIVSGVKFLNTIVTNMLTFSKVSRVQFQDIDLRLLVAETLTFFEPVFMQRQVQVIRPPAEPALVIEADPEMLRQMLINLLMNGLQAMPERGRLSVEARCTEHGVELAVEDTGIGIPEENLERIFDPFFTTNDKGTGLGLSLVHQIVKKHRGSISATSRFGHGTRFVVLLPLKQEEPAAC